MDGLLTSGWFYWAVFVIGYLVVLGLDAVLRKKPLNAGPITTNRGSVMTYAVWQMLIVVLLTLVVLYSWAAGKSSLGTNPPAVLASAYPAAFLLAGAASGVIAAWRARDAGRGRLYALLGVIPIGNLILMFTPPKEDPARPEYRLKALLPRGAVIVVALGVTWQLLDLLSFRIMHSVLETTAAATVDEGVFTRFAVPPTDLAPQTTFSGAEADEDMGRKYLAFVYILTGEGIDRGKVQAWLDDTMRPQTMAAICRDPIIEEKAWYISYEYADPDDISIASTTISRRDCRRMAE